MEQTAVHEAVSLSLRPPVRRHIARQATVSLACPCFFGFNMVKWDVAAQTCISGFVLHASWREVNPGRDMARASLHGFDHVDFTFQSVRSRVPGPCTPVPATSKNPCRRSSRDSSCPLGAIAEADLSELRQQGTWYLRGTETLLTVVTGEPLIWTHATCCSLTRSQAMARLFGSTALTSPTASYSIHAGGHELSHTSTL